MFKQTIAKVITGEDLSVEEARQAMTTIMNGEATPAQIACYLTALRMKGETVEEITGSALVMREKVTPVKAEGEPLVDTCGTGGDGSHTFNISTASALVAAGAGVTVAKHGNYSVSSSSGSADVLLELGVKIDAEVAVVEACLREAGIGFLFAPRLHTAMKYAIGPRREIGIRTIFNILGPLTNPAGASRQVLGVYDETLAKTLAEVLARLGTEHAFVVHGRDGLDEITTTSETAIFEVRQGRVDSFVVVPEDLGLGRAKLEELKVDSPAESAQIIKEVLEDKPGVHSDIVLANAAAALAACDLVEGLKEGRQLAQESIASGRARKALEKLVEVSNQAIS